MKTFLFLILFAGVLAQDSKVSTRIKGLKNAVGTDVINFLVNAGYSVPPSATREDLKAVKKQAMTDGLDWQAIEHEATGKFLDQGVASGTIDADVAAKFLAKKTEKQQNREEKQDNREDKKDLKSVWRGVKDAVEAAQVSALAGAGLLSPDASKKDIKKDIKKQASAAGIDLDTIEKEVTATYLESVDADLVAAYIEISETQGTKREGKRAEKKQGKQAEREAKRAAKKAEKEASRAAKKASKQAGKEASRAAKKTEKEETRAARKAARKAEKEAKKRNKVADRLKKKTQSGN